MWFSPKIKYKRTKQMLLKLTKKNGIIFVRDRRKREIEKRKEREKESVRESMLL